MTTETGEVRVTTGDILMWLTGCELEPPMGLDSHIALRFDETIKYPHVSVCTLELVLPLGAEYRDLVSVVTLYTQLVIDSQGF